MKNTKINHFFKRKDCENVSLQRLLLQEKDYFANYKASARSITLQFQLRQFIVLMHTTSIALLIDCNLLWLLLQEKDYFAISASAISR
jgi:hypothetical protein